MLTVTALKAGYGRIEVLHGVDLTVGDAEIVTIVGANGAGKSTLLKAISGIIPAWSGEVDFAGRRLDRMKRGGHRLAGVGPDTGGPAVVRTDDGGGEPRAGGLQPPAREPPAR